METTGSIHFINLEYFFRVLYNLTGHVGGGTNYRLLLSEGWTLISAAAYAVSFIALGVLIYATMRLFETQKIDEEMHRTVTYEEEDDEVDHSRWGHVLELIESTQESDWRQAIIEADIILDDELTERGFSGTTVAEKLRQIQPGRMRSLQDAWDAHRVRNEIAHSGSEFPLDAHLAYRTISKYKNVFEEFGTI